MTFHTPRDWTTGEQVTEQMLDEQIKDNLNEIWKGSANGDLDYYTSSTSKTRLPIGSTGQILKPSGGVPVWGSILTSVQGYNNTDWGSTGGSVNFVPTQAILQIGTAQVVFSSQVTASKVITFQTAFSIAPKIFITINDQNVSFTPLYSKSSISVSGFTVSCWSIYPTPGAIVSGTVLVDWLAIGPA
jgi:hypothetical protein